MVGATMPRKATNILAEIIPPENLEVISTPHVHRIMPHVHQKFLRLHSEDKALKILELVKREQKRRVPMMVFCNMASTCDWLAHILTENGIPALRLHSKMGGKSRSGVMEAFKSGDAHILVCSDIASRGVDTVQVQHVVNLDFPPFTSDYIHRAGRVGRVGSQGSGHVTNFVVHKWDVELVNKIEDTSVIIPSLLAGLSLKVDGYIAIQGGVQQVEVYMPLQYPTYELNIWDSDGLVLSDNVGLPKLTFQVNVTDGVEMCQQDEDGEDREMPVTLQPFKGTPLIISDLQKKNDIMLGKKIQERHCQVVRLAGGAPGIRFVKGKKVKNGDLDKNISLHNVSNNIVKKVSVKDGCLYRNSKNIKQSLQSNRQRRGTLQALCVSPGHNRWERREVRLISKPSFIAKNQTPLSGPLEIFLVL
ncbi:ATP-dependent RNA helicase abstrakt [Strongylocentrotus purpuratus]|uniref:Helicase C-terminal domain-containing protein n=1 Tax=Strongylocentrotus purpuratus TaxID=7668 RepID=A0A7M7P608_STRPU|nr:ATP-dependent RNA helicase abstrakt [Strongylocentrotus purpuratus]